MFGRAVASFAILLATSAVAADALRERLLQGSLAITGAAGHDCQAMATQDLAVELALDAPIGGFALIGFEDGHMARWTYANGMLGSSADSPVVELQRAYAAEGAEIVTLAPGTETCRWTGRLRVSVSKSPNRAERLARLVALDEANTVLAEAEALLAKGKAPEALPIHERAVAMRRSILGAEHPLVLRAEVRVARSLQLDGKADAARENTERVLAIQRRVLGEDAHDTLKSRVAVGTMYWASGRPQDGLPLVERAYEQLRDRYGPVHLDTLAAQNNLALILWDLGRLPDAQRHLEFQLPAIVAIRGESSQRSLDVMHNLASVYRDMGRHAAALELTERGYRISVASLGSDHPDTLSTLMSVGTGYMLVERVEDALSLFRVSYEGFRRVLGDDHPWTMITQSNVGAALIELQRADEAIEVLGDLVPRAERVMGADHKNTLRWIHHLGVALSLRGDHAAAMTQFDRAYERQVKLFGADHPDVLESLVNVGRSQFASGNLSQGMATLQRVFEDLRRVNGPGHKVTLTAAVSLAEAAASVGDRARAIALLNDVVAAVESLRSDEGLSGETRQAFFAAWASGYKRLALLYGTNDPAAAFRVAELSKARMLLESLALRSADMAGIVGTEDAARLAALDAQASALSHAIAQAAGRGDEAFKLESERNAITRESATFRRDLRVRHPRYAELAEVELIDATRASTLARSGEALISYLVAGDDAIAFVVRRGRPLAIVPLGLIAGLDRSVEAYRTLLVGSLGNARLPVWRRRDGSFIASLARPEDAVAGVQDAQVVGRALAARLIEPLEPALAGARRWIVSPDGALAALPFEALPRKGRPLVVSTTVSYVQSLSVLALMKSRPGLASSERSLLAMGAPRFGDPVSVGAAPDEQAGQPLASQLVRGPVGESVSRSYEDRGLRWSSLPGAAREIVAVAALFPAERRVVALSEAASEQNLRALNASGQLASFRYLLFATHAYLDTVVPARSALVLSQVDLSPGTDGYLTVAKWPAYRLQSELAVLSACETGLGRQVQGEGVMGLPYALFVAGNRATILTLWRIEDDATAAFVTELFRRIQAGVDAATALTATKRSFLAGPLRARAPAVWAPFVLYGP